MNKGRWIQWVGFLIALAAIFFKEVLSNQVITITMLIVGAIVLIIGLFISKKVKITI
ncbi:hypothetical protein LXM61_29805 [Priestia megaterium]|uniref:hypothetical protein n=1 Tax=Priestia megaterium TaxID=1404 RepID=UPI001E6587B2|nr:hypothetical protein [Priestia megaterium]MCE4093314.1 hypothetical protein [Priestia megaterium]